MTKRKKQLYGMLVLILFIATIVFEIAGLIAALLALVGITAGIYIVPKVFLSRETKIRTAWAVNVGELLGTDDVHSLNIHQAQLDATISVIQLLPTTIHEEGFTYYDTTVQNQIASALETAKTKAPEGGWIAETPLAILSPYGTGGNDLYLYFETLFPTRVTYTIHVDRDDIPDYTAIAPNGIGAEPYSKTHEFLMIGLVPGYTNHVTMTITGSRGNTRQTVTFDITMPEPRSGYSVMLSHEDGESTAPLSHGLFSMMRINGYLGYGFFFDNHGVMRYEMVLEGFGTDRFLYSNGDVITCVSVSKLAKFNPLGRVVQVYPLDGYQLHHDICLAQNHKVMALVTKLENKTVEDVLIEIDLNTGEVTELMDFAAHMADYVQNYTRPIQATDPMFFWAGKWDWLHLNTLQYSESDDCIIVSSRETSTIIKVKHIHTAPEIDWFAGNPAFWADTPYSKYCLTPEGTFVFQYGQHTVEYHAATDQPGVYYLRTYNNNYWALSSRDFEMNVEDCVGRTMTGVSDKHSWVYIYKIDENKRTFALQESFPVPYSSIVSNAEPFGENHNWIVNSGVAKVFGEYDLSGTLIRQFRYECDLQNYRTFKFRTNGFWEQPSKS